MLQNGDLGRTQMLDNDALAFTRAFYQMVDVIESLSGNQPELPTEKPIARMHD